MSIVIIRHGMNRWFYAFGWHFARYVTRQCVNFHLLHGERLQREGPFLIACTHLSHLEPFVLSPTMPRPVHWLTRTEHYAFPPIARVLDLCGAIAIKRDRPSVRAIRTSIDRLREGKIVGIFPEGGVKLGQQAAFRGGPVKRGACTIALLAGVPIVPVVMVGTDTLNNIEAWYPGRLSTVWGGVGPDLNPRDFLPSGRPRLSDLRRARLAMADAVVRRFVDGFEEIVTTYNLDRRRIP